MLRATIATEAWDLFTYVSTRVPTNGVGGGGGRPQEQFLGEREEQEGRDAATEQLTSGSPTLFP